MKSNVVKINFEFLQLFGFCFIWISWIKLNILGNNENMKRYDMINFLKKRFNWLFQSETWKSNGLNSTSIDLELRRNRFLTFMKFLID